MGGVFVRGTKGNDWNKHAVGTELHADSLERQRRTMYNVSQVAAVTGDKVFSELQSEKKSGPAAHKALEKGETS